MKTKKPYQPPTISVVSVSVEHPILEVSAQIEKASWSNPPTGQIENAIWNNTDAAWKSQIEDAMWNGL